MNWLGIYLFDCIQRNVCTKIGCTTCGAREFRDGLLAGAARQMQRLHLRRLAPDSASVIAQALAGIGPPDDAPVDSFESAVRLILTTIWATLGEPIANETIEPLLAGSWAGGLLRQMKLHHSARMDARKKEGYDPIRHAEADRVHVAIRRAVVRPRQEGE
jgi:hypothetical protein